MNVAFYISAIVAIISTVIVITRLNAIHALLYFIMSLMATAVMFFVLGAPFAAALVVIINAGAIMVLFVFAIMILNLGPHAVEQERLSLSPRAWIGPAILGLILIIELIVSFTQHGGQLPGQGAVDPKHVGLALFGPYLLGVELASMLLLAGLLGAYHLGPRAGVRREEEEQ